MPSRVKTTHRNRVTSVRPLKRDERDVNCDQLFCECRLWVLVAQKRFVTVPSQFRPACCGSGATLKVAEVILMTWRPRDGRHLKPGSPPEAASRRRCSSRG